MYITISDPQGGIFLGDNSPVVVKTRILIENDQVYGYENLAVRLKKEGRPALLGQLIRLAVEQPTGQFDRFSWVRE